MGRAYFNTNDPELNRVLNELVESMGEEEFEALVDEFDKTPLGELCPVFDERLFADAELAPLREAEDVPPLIEQRLLFAEDPMEREDAIIGWLAVTEDALRPMEPPVELTLAPGCVRRLTQEASRETTFDEPASGRAGSWKGLPEGAEAPEGLRKAA